MSALVRDRWFWLFVLLCAGGFGVLWARTRSLTLLVLLHGMFDTPSNLARFMDVWGL